VRALPGCDWCDLKAGKDFLALKGGHWDWIASNPPFSRFRDFLRKAGFAIVELCALPVPPKWPRFGIELTAGWLRRGWQGSIAHTRLGDGPGKSGQG
jgi:hypothetical protein